MERIIPNIAIRERAFKLFCRSRGRVLLIPGLVYLVEYLLSELISRIADGNALAGSAAELLLSPITIVGVNCFLLNIWLERRAEVADLTSHVRHSPKVWLLSLIQFFTLLAVSLVCGIAIRFSFVASLATLYFRLRFSLAYVNLVMEPDDSAIECISASWTYSKKHTLEIFCHCLLLNLPLIVAEAIAGFLPQSVPAILPALLIVIPNFICTGYISLATVGQAEYILSGRTDLFEEQHSETPSPTD